MWGRGVSAYIMLGFMAFDGGRGGKADVVMRIMSDHGTQDTQDAHISFQVSTVPTVSNPGRMASQHHPQMRFMVSLHL